MNLSALWIRRPVFTIVFSLIPAILGLAGIWQIQVRDLPAFDIPMIQVTTALPGATPDEVAERVTGPLEQAIGTVGSIDTLVSTSDDSLSTIQATFLFGTDSVVAANQVQAAIEQIADQLPTAALKPSVSRLSLDSMPVVYLALGSQVYSDVEISDAARRLVVPVLTTIQGVGSVQIIGDRQPVMQIAVDPLNLASVQADVADAIAGIQSHNVDTPAGSLVAGGFTTGIALFDDDDPVVDVATVPILRKGEQVVTLGDVATVSIVGDDAPTRVTIDGQPAVAIGIMRQSTTNALELVDDIKKTLQGIQAVLPPEMSLSLAFDTTVSIRASLSEVRDTLFLAVVLVIGVVFAFLGSFRSSLVTLVTIPLSLLITVVFIHVAGFSFNTFTLLAFVLAIGLVVDDAIIDVENVQRHVDRGLNSIDAAFFGSAEIGFAIVATTVTLAALYLPIGLAPGMIGALFREFGLTLAVAVLASGLVSRTLSPMMCSRLLRPSGQSAYARLVDRLFEGLARRYGALLTRLLGDRSLIALGALTTAVLGVLAATQLPGELAPDEDEGYILMRLDGPTGATADYLAPRAAAVEAVFQTVPERLGSMIILGMPGANQGYAFLVLKDWDERARTETEIAAAIGPQLDAIAGVQTTTIPSNPLSGGQAQPIQIVIKSTTDYQTLLSVADRVRQRAASDPALSDVNVDLDFDHPRIQLDIHEPLANNLGISLTDIAQTLRSLFGGLEVGNFSWQGSLYKIKVQLPPELAGEQSTIGTVGVRSANGDVVPLETFVDATRVVGPDFLPRFNQLPSATISADPGRGYGSSAGLAALEALIRAELEPGMEIDYAGESRQLKEANASDGLVFVLGLVFIFFTLAAQFESFRDPFIVLMVVPLSIGGALFALALFGGSINLYSAIGLLTLIGLIAKHGILITEFANQLRDRGVEMREAVVEAAVRRLRPILMTTFAMMLGAAPLVAASGAGAVSRHDIGLVLLGGLTVGTLFSLFVVPAVYLMLSRRVRKPLVELSRNLDAGTSAA